METVAPAGREANALSLPPALPAQVIKRDGQRAPFELGKIASAIERRRLPSPLRELLQQLTAEHVSDGREPKPWRRDSG